MTYQRVAHESSGSQTWRRIISKNAGKAENHGMSGIATLAQTNHKVPHGPPCHINHGHVDTTLPSA